MDLISVSEAESLISENSPIYEAELCALRESFGRVLREDLKSQRAHPPFDRVAMDGIGIRFADWQAGCRSFKVLGDHAAGAEPPVLTGENTCFEVMTGSVLPKDADCVIPYERLSIVDGVANLEEGLELGYFQNIHEFGSDHDAGTLLVPKGSIMKSAQISVAATEGKAEVLVSRLPKITVLSTGDELVDVDQDVLPWQIRRSNSYSIVSALKAQGFDAEDCHMDDDPAIIRETLEKALSASDILIMSGGVSMGKFDYIPQVLDELGVKKHFHKIAQRPGKPMWFGTLGEKTIFALPGNPVSTLMTFHRYVIPQIYRSLSLAEPIRPKVRLDGAITFKKSMTYFFPVALSFSGKGELLASPRKTNGSGDFASLCESQGFVELPAEQTEFKPGEVFDFYSWNSFYEF